MNLKKCPNNHYYNIDKFPYCPHCSNTYFNTDGSSADFAVTDDSANIPTAKTPTENIRPQIVASNPYFERLTAGWLVCISGNNRGLSFPIYFGNNHVGRNYNMDIRLKDETTISREDHVIIKYDNGSGIFYLLPGNSSNPTLINEVNVTSSTILNDRDRIQLGECQLVFICLCDGSFNWQ